MVVWRLIYTRQAKRDAKKLAGSGLKTKAQAMLELISEDPYMTPPPFEKLVGDLSGAISRRISIQHRIVYQVIEEEHTVKVLRMWTHYE